jgi:saccharopine dehydrogenase-like NADP-dependent oxidoreductase
MVTSLILYTYHSTVIEAAIAGRTHVMTTSYISDAMRRLDKHAKRTGITVVNEVGVDPSVDHRYAIKKINEVYAKGSKVLQFYLYCGGLPALDSVGNSLDFKFS